MADLVLQDNGNRTTIRFTHAGFDAALDPWAQDTGFRLRSTLSDGRRRFQKGTGLLVAPMMLEVAQNGDDVELTAWVRMGMFVRLMSFFILPPEMGIRSGGFRAAAPRAIARKAVNKLLVAINQPPIP